jgi:chlorophyllide a reductase subunit X
MNTPTGNVPVKKARTIAVYGKGGIGKSFFTTNLTATFSLMNKRVLQIGCDPKHDSTTSLFGGISLPTVTEVFHEKQTHNQKIQVEDIVFKRHLDGFTKEIYGIELGGPEVGRGCGGRGIISGFDVLEKLGLFKWDLDVVMMDFLGDVVCGGFATPLARSLCDEVILVVSNDRQSIFAANNICMANNYFLTVGGQTRLLGLVINRDDGSDIAANYAKAAGINIIARLPYNSEARDKADSFDVAIRVPSFKEKFNDLATRIWNNQIPYSQAKGLPYEAFMDLFGEVDKRKPVSAGVSDLKLEKNLDLDPMALVAEKTQKENFVANGFVQIDLGCGTSLETKAAIGSDPNSLPEQDEFVKKSREQQTAAATNTEPARPLTEQDKLLHAIERLPRLERDLITLSQIRRKTIDEIAIEKQLDADEVGLMLETARQHLKQIFFQN